MHDCSPLKAAECGDIRTGDMCGLYTYFPGELSDLRQTWQVDHIPDFKPRYNIAPSEDVTAREFANGLVFTNVFAMSYYSHDRQ